MDVTECSTWEQFAGDSPGACPAGAGRSVDAWVNGQTLIHPVVWKNVGSHHIARDEDRQPCRSTGGASPSHPATSPL